MRLVITDTGNIWNKDNPFLKKYRNIVLVVCIEGKEVTDEYECFVSPFKVTGLGMDPYGDESRRFNALNSVRSQLCSKLSYGYDDIIFLTDDEPTTLYPYYALKDLLDDSMHLVAMSSLYFKPKKMREGHKRILSDLSKLDSVFYYDADEKLKEVGENTTIREFYEIVKNELGEMLPCVLKGINHMEKKPCYFDFTSMKYIPLKEGFKGVDMLSQNKEVEETDYYKSVRVGHMGRVIPPSYPQKDEEIKDEVERLVPRQDGKKLCNLLREQRIKLAKANHIAFESEECPSVGPCAGTCEKCDEEAAYLREKLKKIPEDRRVYPKFNPNVEE